MMQIDDNDALLVRKVQHGDIRAYETLVRRHEDKLLRFARRYVGDSGSAEEAVQDAFISVYTHIDRVDASKPILSYLFAIVHNNAVSALRKSKPRRSLHEASDLPAEADMEQELERKDMHKRIRDAVSKLPEAYANVIRLHYFDDVSYAHISTMLHIPINTVRTHLRRAKHMLVKLMKL